MTKLEGRQCIAVGHWWEFAPTTAQDFDALLSIATIRESLELIQPGDPWRKEVDALL